MQKYGFYQNTLEIRKRRFLKDNGEYFIYVVKPDPTILRSLRSLHSLRSLRLVFVLQKEGQIQIVLPKKGQQS